MIKCVRNVVARWKLSYGGVVTYEWVNRRVVMETEKIEKGGIPHG